MPMFCFRDCWKPGDGAPRWIDYPPLMYRRYPQLHVWSLWPDSPCGPMPEATLWLVYHIRVRSHACNGGLTSTPTRGRGYGSIGSHYIHSSVAPSSQRAYVGCLSLDRLLWLVLGRLFVARSVTIFASPTGVLRKARGFLRRGEAADTAPVARSHPHSGPVRA